MDGQAARAVFATSDADTADAEAGSALDHLHVGNQVLADTGAHEELRTVRVVQPLQRDDAL